MVPQGKKTSQIRGTFGVILTKVRAKITLYLLFQPKPNLCISLPALAMIPSQNVFYMYKSNSLNKSRLKCSRSMNLHI